MAVTAEKFQCIDTQKEMGLSDLLLLIFILRSGA